MMCNRSRHRCKDKHSMTNVSSTEIQGLKFKYIMLIVRCSRSNTILGPDEMQKVRCSRSNCEFPTRVRIHERFKDRIRTR